jgi:hypothetical protein
VTFGIETSTNDTSSDFSTIYSLGMEGINIDGVGDLFWTTSLEKAQRMNTYLSSLLLHACIKPERELNHWICCILITETNPQFVSLQIKAIIVLPKSTSCTPNLALYQPQCL